MVLFRFPTKHELLVENRLIIFAIISITLESDFHLFDVDLWDSRKEDL